MEDEITEFLKKMGMKGDQPQENQWDRIIVPASSYLIVGDVGTGKTALAFWLLETCSRRYSLTPCVVGLPADKRALLPESFLVLDTPGELTRTERVIALVDEADIQLPIEDTRGSQVRHQLPQSTPAQRPDISALVPLSQAGAGEIPALLLCLLIETPALPD